MITIRPPRSDRRARTEALGWRWPGPSRDVRVCPWTYEACSTHSRPGSWRSEATAAPSKVPHHPESRAHGGVV